MQCNVGTKEVEERTQLTYGQIHTLQRADSNPQHKMEIKHQKISSMKNLIPSAYMASDTKPIIHDRKWTDGSSPWDTLPPRLNALGKVGIFIEKGPFQLSD